MSNYDFTLQSLVPLIDNAQCNDETKRYGSRQFQQVDFIINFVF